VAADSTAVAVVAAAPTAAAVVIAKDQLLKTSGLRITPQPVLF